MSLALIVPVLLLLPASINAKTSVIVVLTDDISYKEYGFAGNSINRTPYLDALVKKGVTFQRAWSNALCIPTRGMLMTGEYATTTGWWGNGAKPLDLGQNIGTFAHVAKDGGYRTLMVGKWQLDKRAKAGKYGFDSYCLWDHSDRSSRASLRRRFYALGGEDFSDDKPSRFWKPLIVRHLGKDRHRLLNTTSTEFGPQIFLDCIRDFILESPKPFFIYYAGVTAHQAKDSVTGKREWIGMPLVDANFNIIGREREGEGSLRSNVEWTDIIAGRIQKILEDAGRDDTTAVLFASDNGSSHYGKASVVSEFGVHVPLVAWGGPIKPRRTPITEMVSLVDIYATVAEFSGGRHMAGQGSKEVRRRRNSFSLVPLLIQEGTYCPRQYNFGYNGKSSLVARSDDYILDGEETLWDCRRLRDEQTCARITTPSGKARKWMKRLRKQKAEFYDDTLTETVLC